MHGNVVEWCLDWFYGDDYSADDVMDPVGEKFDSDLEVSVCRGGSWCSEPYKCRSAFRGISNSYADDYENGFRLVCLTMPETHTVTVANGTDNKGDAINDEKVTITANNPATGMVFDKWTSDDVTFDNANDAETTFQMPDKAVTVTATYKDEGIQKYPVTVTNGTADKDEYAEDETVKIKADEPPSGKVFSHWTSNCGVTFMPADNPTTTFRMPGKYVFVKANWKNAPKYEVTVENGIADEDEYEYAEGETVKITADEPPSGKVFDKWTSDDVTFTDENAATTTFTMPNQAVTVTAIYQNAPKYMVAVVNGSANPSIAYAGEKVTITAANPPDGMVFNHWECTAGNVTFENENDTQTTFSMRAHNVIVGATYRYQSRYTVTVTNGYADKDEYVAGETVTITANNPPAGQVFDKWTGESSLSFYNVNNGRTTFSMPAQDVTVTANYKDAEGQKYKVTVKNGTAEPSEAYAGELVSIAADIPIGNSVFDKWTGNVTFNDENDAVTEFFMPAKDVTVTATYKVVLKFMVMVENGTADPEEAAEGETVEIEANNPPDGKVFDHWVCEIGGVKFADEYAEQTTFTMPGKAVRVQATYKDAQKYRVTVENGTAQPSQTYEGDTVEIEAQAPAEHKLFDKWTSEDGVTFANPNDAKTTFTMLGKAVTVTATYKDAQKYTVTVVNGTAQPSQAYEGETVEITANTPAEHKLFDQWTSDDVTFDEADNAKTTFTMPNNGAMVTANYIDEPIYTVTVRNGTANPSKAYAGQRITIKAETPSLGSVFVQWTGEGVTIRNANEVETTFIMPANDVTVTAYYQLAPKFEVTVEYGSADKTQTFEGDTVAIEAQAPAEHKLFDKWTSEDGVTFADPNVAKTTFTMLGKAVKVTATYKDEPTYTVTVSNGTADPQEAYAGDTVTITANDQTANHLLFDSWTGDVDFDEATAVKTTFVMPANDVAVTATYKDEPIYEVMIRGGMADKKKAYAGEKVSITAEDPEPGMVFDHWWDGNLLSPLEFANPNLTTTTFFMPARDVQVSSVYSGAPTYRVTVKNGTANPSEAYAGQTVTIEANDPAEHYRFGSWTGAVDFVDADAAKTTFVMPGNNVTVTATYQEDAKYTVTVVDGKASKKTAYEGEEITVTAATPDVTELFDSWEGDVAFATATAATTTFVMPANNVTVTATYKDAPKYRVTAINGVADKPMAAAGEIVTVFADEPGEHEKLYKWTYAGSPRNVKSSSVKLTFVMPANDVTVTAVFKALPQYKVTVTNGTADKAKAYAGETVTITANAPAAGRAFDKWSSSTAACADKNAATTTFVMPAKAVTVKAYYKAAP